MDAIILAAGRGTRMAPITRRTAKPMLPLCGRPILDRTLDALASAGVTRAVVVVPPDAAWAASIQAPDGLRVDTAVQEQARGTGHAVAAAAKNVDGDALVVMGDALLDVACYASLASADGFVVAAARVEDPSRYGVLRFEGDRVVGIDEKPEQPQGDRVNAGIYRVPREALRATERLKPSPRGEIEFTDVLHAWAQRGDVAAVDATGWLDIGNPWDYLAAHEATLPSDLDGLLGDKAVGGAGEVEVGVQVHGRAFVAAGARIRSGTYIEGDVWIGPGADIGPNAYLRGPVAIGPGGRVGGASEVKNSILLAGAKAPHHNYVGDSVLGVDANLGSGTKIANLKVTPGTVKVDWDGTRLDTGRRKFGAVVGDDAKVGINCSLNPGTVLGAGCLVGAGKAVSGWVPPRTRWLAGASDARKGVSETGKPGPEVRGEAAND